MNGQALAPGALVADKFRIVRQLGKGGMGSVYEIVHELTHHRRALKLLHAEWAERPDTVQRFLREASAAGRIGNPHIVETFDAGRLPSGEPYLVMELLVGRTLADELADAGVLPLPDLVDLMRQACEGVQAAHDAGIVHRDLKPENLFIVQREGRRFVKVLDFGISKFFSGTPVDKATFGEGMMGTPLYMSPEQLRGGKDVDARSDVYGLGVILYECAVGMHPYPSEELPTLIAKVLEGKTRAPIRELRPDLPTDLSELIERAMAPDRARRVPTARALGLELAALGMTAGDRARPSPESLAATLVAPRRFVDIGDETTIEASQSEPRLPSPARVSGVDASEPAPVARRPADLPSARTVAAALSAPAPAVASETSSSSQRPVETMVSVGQRGARRPLTFLVAGVAAALVAGGVMLARSWERGDPPPRAAQPEPTTSPPSAAPAPEVSPAPISTINAAPSAEATASAATAPSGSAPAASARRRPGAPSSKPSAPAPSTGLATKGEFKP